MPTHNGTNHVCQPSELRFNDRHPLLHIGRSGTGGVRPERSEYLPVLVHERIEFVQNHIRHCPILKAANDWQPIQLFFQ